MKYILLVLAILSGSSLADTVEDNPCKAPQSSTGIDMIRAMKDDMGRDTDTIEQSATKTELVANNRVSDRLASQFSRNKKNLITRCRRKTLKNIP